MYRIITEILMANHGTDISMFDESFVNNCIVQRIEKTACNDATAYCSMIAEDKTEAERLTGSFQVSYSEFFRNPLTFSVLERILLPELIYRNNKNHKLRIWSAACAGGHEAYSMAILLENLMGRSEEFRYGIFATDQDEKQITKAQEGVFYKEAVGKVTLKDSAQWFVQSGNSYSVAPALKKNIRFSVFDLLNPHYSSPPESIYGDFDLVLCANVLFYYKPAYQKIIIEKIKNSLAEDGLIVTGETERELFRAGNFTEVFPKSAIFRKK
jgi:chemotaxis protein methyltransferase CheR